MAFWIFSPSQGVHLLFFPHLFNFSSFVSAFFFLPFLCLLFSPHFHFYSFFSYKITLVRKISPPTIFVSPFQHRPPCLICAQVCIISLTPFCSTCLLESFENKASPFNLSVVTVSTLPILYGLCRYTWKLWKQSS